MSPAQLQAEYALLTLSWPESLKVQSNSVYDLCRKAAAAQYQTVLADPLARSVLALAELEDGQDEFDIEGRWSSLWKGKGKASSELLDKLSNEDINLLRLAVAVSLLQAYIQINWTGPLLPTLTPLSLFSQNSFPSALKSEADKDLAAVSISNSSLSALTLLGEPFYHLASKPTFLQLAILILDSPQLPTTTPILTTPWWRLRATKAHHSSLTLSSPLPLPSTLLPSVTQVLENLPTSDQDLRAALTLEIGLAHQLLCGEENEAKIWFEKAAKENELDWVLTGAMGKRTKWQQEEKTQLVVLARGRDRTDGWVPKGQKEGQEEVKDIAVTGGLPETLQLNDDTLLETTQFSAPDQSLEANATTPQMLSPRLANIDPRSPPALHPLDQALILSLSLLHSNTHREESLTTSQLTPFTSLLLLSPQNWSIHTCALLLRARAESKRTRTVERSVMQMQALVDQIPINDETGEQNAKIEDRLRWFWQLDMPSKWELEAELGKQLGELGVVRSAMEVFQKLEMWDEVVACLQKLEEETKALDIVRSLLAGELIESARLTTLAKSGEAAPSQKTMARMTVARRAKLICLLGDLVPDEREVKYKEAWEESNHTSSRAARSLAGVLFAKKRYPECIPFFEAALAINPLYSRSWFILGCAYVNIEDWKNAVNCFKRVVAIEEDDAEGWNNLASCYLRMPDVDAPEVAEESTEDEAIVESEPRAGDIEEDSARIPMANKILAHRALKIGLKYTQSNWRMWSNYLLVCVDLGEMSEACRALTRVVEQRAAKDGEDCIDIDVLDRLVSSVTKGAPPGSEAAKEEAHSPNVGSGLLPTVNRLFEQVILPRITSSSRIYQAQAKIFTWETKWAEALDAYVKAYRASVVPDETVDRDVKRWREAVVETSDLIDMMSNLGPKAVDAGADEWKDWKFQARSIVRTFMGRTKDSFEDEAEWDTLKELLNDLKGK